MQSPVSTPKMIDFLINAKRRTYASMDDNAAISSPLLDGSKQLEWQDGDWLYRDIYYGMWLFTAIEVVYFAKKPLWAMSYSGGTASDADIEQTEDVYTVLRSALMGVPAEFPVRRPSSFSSAGFSYHTTHRGDLESFSGHEEISLKGVVVYELTFTGGLVH